MTVYSPVKLSRLINPISKRCFNKRGFYDPSIVLLWNKILPEAYTRYCFPSRLRQNRHGERELIIAVVPSKITEIYYFSENIKRLINQYFSINMIDKVSFESDNSMNSLNRAKQNQKH